MWSSCFPSENAQGVAVQLVRFQNLTTVVDHQTKNENQDKKEFLQCCAHECTLNCCRTSAEGFQGGAVVFLHPLVSVLEQQADCRGGSVKLVYLQPLDCLPVPPCQRDKSNRNRALTWSCSLKIDIAGITLSLTITRHACCPARLYTEGLILVFDSKQLFIGRDTDTQRVPKQRSCALTKTLAASKSWRRDN